MKICNFKDAPTYLGSWCDHHTVYDQLENFHWKKSFEWTYSLECISSEERHTHRTTQVPVVVLQPVCTCFRFTCETIFNNAYILN